MVFLLGGQAVSATRKTKALIHTSRFYQEEADVNLRRASISAPSAFYEAMRLQAELKSLRRQLKRKQKSQ